METLLHNDIHLVVYLLSFLDKRTLIRSSQVNKTFHHIVSRIEQDLAPKRTDYPDSFKFTDDLIAAYSSSKMDDESSTRESAFLAYFFRNYNIDARLRAFTDQKVWRVDSSRFSSSKSDSAREIIKSIQAHLEIEDIFEDRADHLFRLAMFLVCLVKSSDVTVRGYEFVLKKGYNNAFLEAMMGETMKCRCWAFETSPTENFTIEFKELFGSWQEADKLF
eukprot:TRINITY_DN5454_c0_g1_i1.p1 TRINITY_DN5454_c0_g1~~TRINITY_DN5454_c0_g1_i1.p1  ORF type:complete len:220 (-),score=39.37 TRINITY_DN5454_c0_g1_i1:32-691(-)